MAFRWTLRCPECNRRFKWRDETLPDTCPLCEAVIGTDEPDTVTAPYIHLKSGALASADMVYRQMEESSEQRVQAAAELAKCDPSEMSSLRVTNLNDRRDAPVAAMQLPPNPVSQLMANGVGGFGQNGMGYSDAVASGPHPNAGARVQALLRQDHATRWQGTVVSDQPALEVMAPGYRRRV